MNKTSAVVTLKYLTTGLGEQLVSRPGAPPVSLGNQRALDGHEDELKCVDDRQHGVDLLLRAAGRQSGHTDGADHYAEQRVQDDAGAGRGGQHGVQRGQLVAVVAQLAHLVETHAAQQRAGRQDCGQRGGRHPEQRVRREVHVVPDHQEYDDHHDGRDQRQQAQEQALVGAREAHALRHVHPAQLGGVLLVHVFGHRHRLRVAFRRFYLANAHVLTHHVRNAGSDQTEKRCTYDVNIRPQPYSVCRRTDVKSPAMTRPTSIFNMTMSRVDGNRGRFEGTDLQKLQIRDLIPLAMFGTPLQL